MYTPNNNQHPFNSRALPVQDSLALMQVDQKPPLVSASSDMQNKGVSHAEFFVCNSKKLQDDLKMLGLKLKHHEDNIKLLKSKKIKEEESILNMQADAVKLHSPGELVIKAEEFPCDGDMAKQIERHENSAAAIWWKLKTAQVSQVSWIKDVIGVVASLGKLEDENLSRIFSEYLGLQKMLAAVCRTFEGVQSLEPYDNDSCIIKNAGIHGLGASIGRQLDGRFTVICLESLRPYMGDCIANDPQRRLDLLKPRLSNGESPPGFLGFAVNMIHLENSHLLCVTSNGYGLRETLFYHLFSRLQVYQTRTDMLRALPYINDGALSLDGGMIRTTGVFSLGQREDVDVKFPICSGASLPVNHVETKNSLMEAIWRKERLQDDIRRELSLLDNAKTTFDLKKQDFVKFLAESSSYLSQGGQQQMPAAR